MTRARRRTRFRRALLVVTATAAATLAVGACAGDDGGAEADSTALRAGSATSTTVARPAISEPLATAPAGTGVGPATSIIAPATSTASGGALPAGSIIDVSAVASCAELAEAIVPLLDGMGVDSFAEAAKDDALYARLTATVGQIQARQTALGCDVNAMNAAACAALASSPSPLAQEYVIGSC